MSERESLLSAERSGWLHIRSYCICGSKLDARSTPPDAAEELHRTWREKLHTGEGHGPCDAATAHRARKKALS